MEERLEKYLSCNVCNCAGYKWSHLYLECMSCGAIVKIIDDIPRYVDGSYHSNFGLQWNKFSRIQLDSFNGSNESESRLLFQSKIDKNDLDGKLVLEIGAGNGRFTEILLKNGACVISVDFSTAIEANLKNHHDYYQNQKFLPIQADLFNLPIKKESFDMVFCYGVIQHTGDNDRAIQELAKFPKKNGRLFLDIYSNGIRHLNPFIYLIRPFFSLLNISDERRLNLVERFVHIVFPLQLKLLRRLHNEQGMLRFLRYALNRSPNSVYGINLFLDGKITADVAFQWSVMDTYDAWAPRHDHPVSAKKWKDLIGRLEHQYFRVDVCGISGQGHFAALTRLANH